MTEDDDTAPSRPLGPAGEPLVGLETRHERVPKQGYKPSRKERPAEFTRRGRIPSPDPLDRVAQQIPGTDDYVRLDAPVPVAVVESQVMWLVIARVDGGPWTHQLVAENVRAASFASRRRAEGVVEWLKRTAQTEGTGAEYRLLPLLRHEQQI